jgi:hypothetical protein
MGERDARCARRATLRATHEQLEDVRMPQAAHALQRILRALRVERPRALLVVAEDERRAVVAHVDLPDAGGVRKARDLLG